MMRPWDALCWMTIITGLLIACAKKPNPPPPIPDNQNPTEETSEAKLAKADERPLEGMSEDKAPTVLYFDLNSATLKQPSQATALARSLKASGKAVRLDGHTCPLGEDAYNMALGYHRAQAVRDYLVAYGVLGGRIEIVSYGEERPVSMDVNLYHISRRVEVVEQ